MKKLMAFLISFLVTISLFAGDNFVRGYTFDGATGLMTGANLEDLVTLATFAAGSGALDQVTIEDDGGGKARVKDGGITEDKLASDAVTADKIADYSIDSDNIKTQAIDLVHMSTGSVDSTVIVDNTIVGDDIATNTIELVKIEKLNPMVFLGNNTATTTSVMEVELLDEDDFASNSPTNPPSQQSVKEYVTEAATHLFAIFKDEKSNGTDGGSITAGVWTTRDLNTTNYCNISGCSLTNDNQIIVPAGTYYITFSSPVYHVDEAHAKLWNVTTSSTIFYSTSIRTTTTSSHTVPCIGKGVVTFTEETVVEVQQKCSRTQVNNGLGDAVNMGTEVYTWIEIWKL